jgi:ferredoxin
MRVQVDPRRCCGSGLCALSVPDVFDQDEGDAKVVILVPEPASELQEGVRLAAAACPSMAITLGA